MTIRNRSLVRPAGRASLAGLALCAAFARAQGPAPTLQDGHAGHAAHAAHAAGRADASAAPAGLPAVPAEVRKVDAAAGRLTLRHAPIPNLGMQAMTMVFDVADPALLAGLRAGDRVAFTAERGPGDRLTVRSLAPAP